MNINEYWKRSDACSLREQGTDADYAYLGWVPVAWTEEPTSVEDADDWREIVFYHSGSESEALAELRLAFGRLAEIEAL